MIVLLPDFFKKKNLQDTAGLDPREPATLPCSETGWGALTTTLGVFACPLEQ